MQKIMFNDKYGLTEAVLEGRKTQTRRVIPVKSYNRIDWKYFEEGHNDCIIDDDISILICGHYYVGEVVAIAQAYRDTKATRNFVEDAEFIAKTKNTAGWRNKMFVKADLMPSHVKITNIRVERLQDISDEDCLKEGVNSCHSCNEGYCVTHCGNCFNTPREAFAHLIDKVSGKGTWDKNPWVFVYDFELVD